MSSTTPNISPPRRRTLRLNQQDRDHWLSTAKYFGRTLLKTLFIIWLVTTLTFFIIRTLPGNPVDIMVMSLMDTGLSEEEAQARAKALFRIDFDKPVMEQYTEFMNNLLHGDLGDSYVLAPGKPVMDILMQRLPWTLFSAGISLLISFMLGIFLGMIAAYKRNSWIDQLLTNVSAILDAVPNTLTAILLVMLLGLALKVVPFSMMRGSLSPGIKPGFTLEFFVDAFRHLLVPCMVYVLSTLGGWMLAMRSSTISALGDDYVTVAKARGLPDMRIITAYVGRNASLPLFTGLAISLGFVVAGSVLIELIFVYQGVGLLLSQAIAKRDYPLMQGILLMLTIMVILSTAVADLLYGWLDPRIRIASGEK
jgi:peptide/nickel transport system permease protein